MFLCLWLCCWFVVLFFFFFFQAEDGIRDGRVTGVKTCALPIYRRNSTVCETRHRVSSPRRATREGAFRVFLALPSRHGRSEERRVGKEWRSRGGAERCKKKEKGHTVGDGRRRNTSSEVRRRRAG